MLGNSLFTPKGVLLGFIGLENTSSMDKRNSTRLSGDKVVEEVKDLGLRWTAYWTSALAHPQMLSKAFGQHSCFQDVLIYIINSCELFDPPAQSDWFVVGNPLKPKRSQSLSLVYPCSQTALSPVSSSDLSDSASQFFPVICG